MLMGRRKRGFGEMMGTGGRSLGTRGILWALLGRPLSNLVVNRPVQNHGLSSVWSPSFQISRD